jgi:hypothetical protein
VRRRGSSKVRNRVLFFSVNPGERAPILPRRFLSAARVSGEAFTHSDAMAISVIAMPWAYAVGFAPSSLRRWRRMARKVSGSTRQASE